MNSKILKSIALSAVLASSLYADANSLGEVVVTAKSNSKIKDTGGSFTIITKEEIERMNAPSIEEILEETVGLSATVNSNSISGRKNISIRGMESKHTLILLNGKKISGSDAQIGHSNFQYNWIPIEAIEKIEIIRGPMSSIYGSQALGGVVNVITRQPSKKVEGSIDIEGGNAHNYNGGEQKNFTGRVAGKLNDQFSYSIIAEKKRTDEILNENDSQSTDIEGKDLYNVMLDMWFNTDETQRFHLSYLKGEEDRIRWGSDNTVLTHYNNYYELEKTHLSLTYEKDFEDFTLNVEAYQNQSDNQANMLDFSVAAFPISMAGNSNQVHRMTDNVFKTEVNIDSISNNYIVFGAEMRREYYHKDYISSTKTDFQDSALFQSIYAQDEITLNDDLILTLGSRYDHHDKFGGEFSPKAYLVYNFMENHQLKGGYGRGFNAPTVSQNSDAYSVTASGGKTFKGNDNLKAETSDTFELGYGFYYNNLKLEATAFHTNVKNLITPDEVTTNNFVYKNIEKARMSGLELEYTQKEVLPKLDISTNYTYLKTKNKSTGNELRAKPKHKANVKINYLLPADIESTVRYSLTGTQKDSDNNDLGSYGMVGIQLKKEVYKDLDIRVGVENLNNKQLGDKYNFDIRGRFIYAGLKYSF